MKLQFSPLGLMFLLFAVVALSNGSVSCKKVNNPVPPQTIEGVITSNESFSLLASAVQKAGLSQTLSSTGPFTLFAPNNDAFQASGITSDVVNALSADQLKVILLYHTLASKVVSANVPAGRNTPVATANGDSIYLTKNRNGVFVNGVKVIQADVAASNGVIHMLGNVLMPPAGNLVVTAQSDTSFSYLVAAVLRSSQGSTNVAGVLSGNGPFTVFAPTNQAFRNAGFPTIASIQVADPNTLATILTYHVIAGRIFSSDLSNGAMPATLKGEQITISLTNVATVKGAKNSTASNISKTNIVATNGVVHVIDQVLLP